MSHPLQAIPWSLLADNVEWRSVNHCVGGASNFHLRFLPDQAESLRGFVTAVTRAIRDCADIERRKFPEDYAIPSQEDIVITNDVAIQIEPTIRKWLEIIGETLNKEPFCCHQDEVTISSPCRCALPYKERKMGAFLRRHQDNDCAQFLKVNQDAFFNLEVVKTLILHGEMDIVLQICSHPDISLADWWEQSSCADSCYGMDVGWNHLYETALYSYILLSLLSCFTDTWDSDYKPSILSKDYRLSEVYQTMVRFTTVCVTDTEVVHFPHRRFFGIGDSQFVDDGPLREPERWPEHTREYKHSIPYGLMSYEEFLSCQRLADYQPSATEVEEVRVILQDQGLPLELVEMILCNAKYRAGQLPVPHRPFHPENSVQLESYLEECWNIVVRCELMARALGLDLDWEKIVNWKIIGLFYCSCCRARFPNAFDLLRTEPKT